MTKITYKLLRDELESRGWKAKLIETDNFGVKRHSTVFQNPRTDLYIILPKMRLGQLVEPIHLLHVRNVLENAGFWDSLVGQAGTDGSEDSNVLQTLAGIKPAK